MYESDFKLWELVFMEKNGETVKDVKYQTIREPKR